MKPLSRTAFAGVLLTLALLMLCTRGYHAASMDMLPSASWAVFFLAGLWLRRWWSFALLFALSTALGFGWLNGGQVDPWCVSPSYGVLLPAYGSLWLAGWHALDLAGMARLVAVLWVATPLAYVFSGGGFYFLSGRYTETSLAGFAVRIARYYPQRLGVLTGYVGAGMALHALWRQLSPHRPADKAVA